MYVQRKCSRKACRRTWPPGARTCPGCSGRQSSWIARYRAPDGGERSQAFDRKPDAERYLADQETRKGTGNWIDPRLASETLGSYYTRWRARATTTGKPAERTLIAYHQVWRSMIEPSLGARPLGSITRADCQAVVDAASTPWRAIDCRKVLSSLLGSAVRDELIARNPATRLDVPKIDQAEPGILTAAEVERLASAIDPEYRAMVLLGAYGSLRWSELVGLRVTNVDFLRRRVRVEEKITESGKMIHGEPKTKRSRRWVSIPESVVMALAEHLEHHHGGGNLLFPGPDGGPLRRKTFGRAWERARTVAELPGFRFGNLRHTGATLALQAGVSPVLVAFRLGHSSTRMIEQHYGRLIESMDADIAERLGDARASAAGPLRDPLGQERTEETGNPR